MTNSAAPLSKGKKRPTVKGYTKKEREARKRVKHVKPAGSK